MIKKLVKKLDNGLTIVCVSNDKKHYQGASINIKYGFAVNDFYIDNREYHYPDGLAHLLEHTLIEDSIYGNAGEYFLDNYVDYNGETYDYFTKYYIITHEDFTKHLVELINMVNNSKFSKEKQEEIKPPIYEEIKGKKDNRYFNYNMEKINSLYNEPEYKLGCGEVEDVKKFTYEDLNLIYNAFYKPSNEILTVYGNFDIEKIVKVIEDTYNSIDRKYLDFKVIKHDEKEKVKRDYYEMVDDKIIPSVSTFYKMKFDEFRNVPKDNLLWYLDLFLRINFSRRSTLYKELYNDGVTLYPINYGITTPYNYSMLVITIDVAGDDKERILKRVDETINKKIMPTLEDFTIFKNRSLMSFLFDEDNPGRICGGYLSNVLSFNREEFDSLDDIKKLDYNEMKEYISSLEFSNKTVIVTREK